MDVPGAYISHFGLGIRPSALLVMYVIAQGHAEYAIRKAITTQQHGMWRLCFLRLVLPFSVCLFAAG